MTAQTTLEPIEIGDVTIPANNRVACMLGSSNRDPERFEPADELEWRKAFPLRELKALPVTL
jgi:cytochrome P450